MEVACVACEGPQDECELCYGRGHHMAPLHNAVDAARIILAYRAIELVDADDMAETGTEGYLKDARDAFAAAVRQVRRIEKREPVEWEGMSHWSV